MSLKAVSINDHEFFESPQHSHVECKQARDFYLAIAKVLDEISLGKFDKEGFSIVKNMNTEIAEKDEPQ